VRLEGLGQLNSHPMGTGALSPRVMRQGREDDHSTPHNAEAKKGGTIPQLSICPHGIALN
jgi:hypothetical protein